MYDPTDIGTCEACDHPAHPDDLRQCDSCENHFHEECGNFTEVKKGWLCSECVESIEYYCEECNIEVSKEDLVTPIIRGVFGKLWVHRECQQEVTKFGTPTNTA